MKMGSSKGFTIRNLTVCTVHLIKSRIYKIKVMKLEWNTGGVLSKWEEASMKA